MMFSRYFFAHHNQYVFAFLFYDTSSHRDLLFTVSVFSHSKTEVETCHFFYYVSSASTPSICAAAAAAATAVVMYSLRSFQHRLSTPKQVSTAVAAVVGVFAVPTRSRP